uniref:FAD-binding oxidoreductase/transferase type 4 C-terminal domain-containing protein n=1 Tax=Amazona collaria TaxID=241587 RepID=A0A8B9G9B6_9PSIT
MVWPHVVGQVQELAAHCCYVPMVPFGIGSPCGAPWQGSICFDLSHMDAVAELSLEDFPGTGLWFPVDPGANASLCGMVAMGTLGTNMVCFGTMHPNVLNLHVVLSDRCLLHTAGASPGGHRGVQVGLGKRMAGYDLTSLFMGSKGTLGFLTQAMLHLHSLPEASAATAFPSMQAVMDCTMQVLQTITLVGRIEFLDEVMVGACSSFNSMELLVVPMPFLELHGSWHGLAKQQRQTGRHSTSDWGPGGCPMDVDECWWCGGTCTREHSVGLGKRVLLLEELGQEGLDTLCSIKDALDPHNLMSPSRVL